MKMIMIIRKNTYVDFNPEIHKKPPTPLTMYWKVGFGWVAMDYAASKFESEERAVALLENLFEKCSDQELLNLVEIED